MAELALEGVSKHFGTVMAVDGVDLEIAHGEFVVFVGPSGCGKSTMLRLISGLESVTAGRIRIGGRDMTHAPPSRRGVAMVFQSYALFPHMTAAENIAFGLRLARTPKDEITRRVTEVAATLQIEALLERYPRELSGGQRQRVAIGRSIIRDPQVFLFDEPLSNLDAALRVRMRLEIARLHDRLDATMVYVTHDQTEAMTLADRIVVINDGRIEQVGAPVHLYDAPANLFVAGFIGAPAMNFVPAVVESPEGSGKQVRFGSVSLPLPDVREAVPGPLPASGSGASAASRPSGSGVWAGHVRGPSGASDRGPGRGGGFQRSGGDRGEARRGVADLFADGILNRSGHHASLAGTARSSRRRDARAGRAGTIPPLRRDGNRPVGAIPAVRLRREPGLRPASDVHGSHARPHRASATPHGTPMNLRIAGGSARETGGAGHVRTVVLVNLLMSCRRRRRMRD